MLSASDGLIFTEFIYIVKNCCIILLRNEPDIQCARLKVKSYDRENAGEKRNYRNGSTGIV